ncbi:Secondary metabolism regulator LAE1 [Colletotrichum orbiculare MAFF 240422]|uniref:Secondary metabolism regulator LAE1 n=1 Tax=Colletotrichum orbiculare (strain 104-T / ATCC 96160 / CBS 514.97 / LARS 414 / MAFF 240422) TaxID=1213857 RepID=A0A484FUT4_COLOR|nr:Secondary metabolism regulator LAE1 [Colletotrichum orbiculare MAFF 240422]
MASSPTPNPPAAGAASVPSPQAAQPTASSPAAAPASPPTANQALAPTAVNEDTAGLEADDAARSVATDDQMHASSLPVPHTHTYTFEQRYHAYKSGAYNIPNDEAEMDRLDVAHSAMVNIIGNKLYLAPLEEEKIHRILDVGTGTGIWAMEMADLFPNAEIIGNDLSAIQPSWLPPNVKFEIDDVESPWIGIEKYDYIYVRFMLVSIKDWPALVQNIFDNLNPGGWVEFQDLDGHYYSEDGSYTEEHATRKWNKEYLRACDIIGRTARPGPQLEGWVRDAGFTEITHQKFKVPFGPWPKDPYYKHIGMINLAQLLGGLEGFSLKLFCEVLGWTKEEVIVMLASVRNELQGGAFHAMYNCHVVYAQKPEIEGQSPDA